MLKLFGLDYVITSSTRSLALQVILVALLVPASRTKHTTG
jgi:hypothetical protein